MSSRLKIDAWTGRRIGLTAALIYLFGNLLPVLEGYETYNGLETALLFLNEDGTKLYGLVLFVAFALAIGFGLSCFFMKGRGAIVFQLLFFSAQTALFITAWIVDRWALLAGGWVCVLGLAFEAASAAMTAVSGLQTKNKKP